MDISIQSLEVSWGRGHLLCDTNSIENKCIMSISLDFFCHVFVVGDVVDVIMINIVI